MSALDTGSTQEVLLALALHKSSESETRRGGFRCVSSFPSPGSACAASDEVNWGQVMVFEGRFLWFEFDLR